MKRTLALVLGAWTIGCGGESAPPPQQQQEVTCDAEAAEGLAVSATDPYGGQPFALGYPPYAIDDCSLTYVSATGELRLRDLATGADEELASAADTPRRPTIAGDLVAWEAMIGGLPSIRVRGSGGTKTIAGAFDHAGEPRVAADAVVFTGWLDADDGGDTDVFLYTPSTGAVVAVAAGPAQQRFPDVSATHIAWSDFAEDPDGAFGADADAADVVVLDRESGAETRRARPGKQAFPMLGAAGKIAYLDWGLVHPEPKFSEYDVRLGPVDGDGAGDAEAAHVMTQILYVRPVLRGERLSWVTTDSGGSALLQRGVDLATPEETVSLFMDGGVFGPSASGALTLVGASSTDSSVTLRAFMR